MAVEVHIEHLFPTPLYSSNIDVDNIDFSDVIYASDIPEISLTSKNDMLLSDVKYSSLKEQIDAHMNHFYNNVLGYSEEVYLEMSSSWLVRLMPGQQSHSHTHANSIFSGVLYLNAEEKCGDIVFNTSAIDDRNIIQYLNPPIKNRNIYNDRVYTVTPQKGLLLIFPSTLQHKVERNCSNSERVSLAFNYFLKGKFQTHTAKLELR